MDFNTTLLQYQRIINNELDKYIEKQDCLEKVLNQSVEYSLMAGGKRIRPILILASYKLFDENYEKAFLYAVALEMVHNCSLIHDDLPGIDNDDIRHGKPTNHRQFNEATAILAGDKLLNEAYILISNDLIKSQNDANFIHKLRIFNEFAKAIDNLIIGEYLDTELEGKKIEKDTLQFIHNNTTGALLKLSVRIGAILANANENEIENLTMYADKIGLAFQIKDDILSEEGDSKQTGKPVGNDKKAGKCTYVSLYGIDEAKRILDNITNEALELLKPYKEKAEFLVELTKYIKNRNK